MHFCCVQIKAGLRVAVQPHGGHFWSSMGQVQRPMDIVSLRIDNQVRFLDVITGAVAFALELAQVISCFCRRASTLAALSQA